MSKKIGVIIGLIVLILVLLCGLYFSFNVNLKKDRYVFEYGDPVEIDQDQLFEDSWIEPKNIKVDDSKIKDKVGKYTVLVTYDIGPMAKEKEIQVLIKDTKKPEIKQIKDVVISVNEKDHDFSEYFQVKDQSEYKVSYQLDKVDFSKPGTYEGSIVVKDASKNKKTLKFDIQVDEEATSVVETKPQETENNESTEDDPSYVKGIMIVNKKHGLPANYAPGENAEAKSHLVQLIADMQASGLQVSNSYSGYRSYEYQAGLYQRYVNSYGQQQADTFSARPGYSEHQTGLAFDLLSSSGQLLETPAEVNWLANHAHKYGFIVRYQAGKEHITGYVAETWHIRYVGDEAEAIYNSGLTLEEYLGVEGGDYE